MQSETAVPLAEEVDVGTLGRTLWRAKTWVIGLAAIAGVACFAGLSTVRPLYTSEARILIDSDVSPFTRAAADLGRDQLQALDEQALQSQVQVLTSRDLALDVTRSLDLEHHPEFTKDAGASLTARLLDRLGLGRGSKKSATEKAADVFEDHLSVYALNKSNVIAVDYASGDPELAAQAANTLAEAYIDWQRKAKLKQTKDATAWPSSQIEALRKKVSESEAAVEEFRSSHGLFAGSSKVTLSAQQLSELNSQLILAKAQKSEADARARLIKKMLADDGDIDAAPEVLKSELIGRLIEQRVQVQRQLAELSATLLPSHPRIKELTSELADIRGQIRQQASKIVKRLENEAEVASVREQSLRNSLNEVKSQASGQSEAEIELRALEREAKANRDLLAAYLARYRDASARHELGSVPANATIVSRAQASTEPSFPKRGAISALAAAATALLALAFVLTRRLIGGPARAAAAHTAAPQPKHHKEPSAPAPPASALEPERLAASPQPAAAGEPREESMSSTIKRLEEELLAVSSNADEEVETASDPSWRWGGQGVEEPLLTPTATAKSLFERVLAGEPAGSSQAAPRAGKSSALPLREELEAGAPNDLRSYLQRRAALRTRDGAREAQRKEWAAAKLGQGKVGPVQKSLDAVLNHVRVHSAENMPRAVLVVAGATGVDATGEAIRIGRALLPGKQRGVLVDLTRGATAISGQLGLPRAPGFTDLAAGRARFDDVVHVDDETPLQVIPAGNPTVRPASDETERVARIVEALEQVYDFVVLHVDPDTAHKLEPALEGRLNAVVAVHAPDEGKRGETSLAELTRFGCCVVPYEQTESEVRSRRSGLFRRAAAI